MRYRIIQVWLVAAIILFSPEATLSRALMPTFEMLTRTASLIVVAQVENVTKKGDVSIATARVIDVWKGRSAGIVQFRASKSWTCDVSNAIPGETVVLFLADDAQTNVIAIAYSGVGRLPVDNDEGIQTVRLYGSLFTKALKQKAGVPPETFSGHVTLAMLKRHVQQMTQREVRPVPFVHKLGPNEKRSPFDNMNARKLISSLRADESLSVILDKSGASIRM